MSGGKYLEWFLAYTQCMLAITAWAMVRMTRSTCSWLLSTEGTWSLLPGPWTEGTIVGTMGGSVDSV